MSKYYLTTKEAAQILNVHPETIRRKTRTGILKFKKKEARILIPRREIDKLITKYRKNPQKFKNKIKLRL